MENWIIYALNEMKRNWKNKEWWKDRFAYHVAGRIYRIKNKNNGVYIMDEDWDNLIILDACRYDVFCDVYGKSVDYRISRGSNTPEFLQKNFVGRKFFDTIYITANPFVDKFCKKSFYKIISVWKNGWDDDLGTVHPKTVVEYSLDVIDKFSDKRLIIHFLQPHAPYIAKSNFINLAPPKWDDGFERYYRNPWILVRTGKLDVGMLRLPYKENLKLVLKYALGLAKKLKGKTVITADHGEAFGERIFPFPIRIYEHPGGIHIPALVKVPWLVIKKGDRRKIKKASEKELLKEHIKSLKNKITIN